MGHPPFKCWKRPDTKCNQLGHEAIICGTNFNMKPMPKLLSKIKKIIILLATFATSFLGNSNSEYWLIDSGCTNHMVYDKTIFKDLKPTKVSKVIIGNDDYISTKGKGTIVISTSLGTKVISYVLYVPNIDQNLCKSANGKWI